MSPERLMSTMPPRKPDPVCRGEDCRVPLGIAGEIVPHRELIDLFRDLADRLRSVLSFDYISFALYDGVSNRMNLHAFESGEAGPVPLPDQIAVEDSAAGWAWQNQQSLFLADLQIETRFPKVTSVLRTHGIRAFCVVPMTTANRKLGAIELGSRVASAYGDADFAFMRNSAHLAAVAIDNVLRRRQVAHERDHLRLLLGVTNTLACLNLQELFSAIATALQGVIQHEQATLSLYDSSSRLRIYTLGNPNQITAKQMDTADALIERVSKEVLAQQRPRVFRRGEFQAQSGSEAEEIAAICCVPIATCRRQLGAITLLSRRNDAFDSVGLDLLVQVATQVGRALETASAFHDLAELKERLAQEKLYLEDEIRTHNNFEQIVGESAALKRILAQAETVAPSDATVLVLGETGTGKELIARAIHDLSSRKSRTFVKLNCAAIPTGLLESELFGHEKGAFTGAISKKVGRFELADLGTLFLDEVGDIPLELQPKLLRALQEQEFERLGGTRTIRVNARLVAATNRDLGKMVADGTFRSDLYYRLKVFPILVPALREREEDIPLLVRYYVQKFAARMNKEIESIPTETMKALVKWRWPGNVRELANVIERAVILTKGPVLHVPVAELQSEEPPAVDAQTLEDAERDHITRALRETNGVIAGPRGAAVRLGLKRTTLLYKMEKLGIFPHEFRK